MIYIYIYIWYIYIHVYTHHGWWHLFLTFGKHHPLFFPPSETHQEFISEISGIASGEFALEQQLQKARGGNQLSVAIAQKNSTMAQWLVIW